VAATEPFLCDDDILSRSRSAPSNIGVVGFERKGGETSGGLVSEVEVSAKSPSWLVAAWINADSPLYAVDIFGVICDVNNDMAGVV